MKSLNIQSEVKALLALSIVGLSLGIPFYASAATDTGSVGIEGKISKPPPTRGATITFPSNGAVIRDVPVNVTGLCPNGLIVKVYKNNVFAGAAECKNGSYQVKIDLFAGRNELVARVFDELDQAGPDSNKVTVTFPVSQFSIGQRISLTSPFAKRGADPGKTLVWPIILSGGNGPYAITVDWGDGKQPDVISQQFAGSFDISHVYDNPGVYVIIVRAADAKGEVAFLQLIGVANGQAGQSSDSGDSNNQGTLTRTKILWQPLLAIIPMMALSFWLGRRHEEYVLRKRLERHTAIK
jgi:hypothetical protein